MCCVCIEVCVVFWPQSPGPVSPRIPTHPHPPRPTSWHTGCTFVIYTLIYSDAVVYLWKHILIYRVFFFTGTPPKSTKKLIWARLGVSRPIYVNVDSPNLGFPYFNFLGGYQLKKTPCMTWWRFFSSTYEPIKVILPNLWPDKGFFTQLMTR